MLVANEPRTSPVNPPIEKRKMNVITQRNGGWGSIDPLYIVATQLNIFTPLGKATINVRSEKIQRAVSLIPLENI